MTDNAPTPHPEDQPDTYTDLTARLAAADLGWSHEHGDPPANPDYIKRLAFQVMAFKPPLIAGVYVDDEMLDDMRDGLHGDNCGCGEWDSHSQEYVERMDETIHAVLYPLRHPARPFSQGTEDSDYRERISDTLWETFEAEGGRLTPGALTRLTNAVLAVRDQELRDTALAASAEADLVDGFRSSPPERPDGDYREQIAEVLHAAAVDVPGTPQVGPALIERQIAALWPRVSPLVEQLRQARAAYNRMAAHAVDRAAERDRYYLAWQSAARGRRGVRAELAAAGRAIECFLGVEYGTPVGSARALVERCVDAERALDGIRATAVVLPEDWCDQLDWAYCGEHRLGLNPMDLIESWLAAPVEAPPVAEVDKSTPGPLSEEQRQALVAAVESGTYLACDGEYYANLPDCERCEATGRLTECPDCDGTGKIDRDGPVEAETPAPLAEPVRERDVVDFLLARHEASPLARCTGISSDALAYYAAGGRAEPAFPNEYPHDGTDLAACEKTYQMAPVQLRERILPILERFRAHVASPGTGTEAGE